MLIFGNLVLENVFCQKLAKYITMVNSLTKLKIILKKVMMKLRIRMFLIQ